MKARWLKISAAMAGRRCDVTTGCPTLRKYLSRPLFSPIRCGNVTGTTRIAAASRIDDDMQFAR
jgi:hypothetical protein